MACETGVNMFLQRSFLLCVIAPLAGIIGTLIVNIDSLWDIADM
jgi:hypothetical protein